MVIPPKGKDDQAQVIIRHLIHFPNDRNVKFDYIRYDNWEENHDLKIFFG